MRSNEEKIESFTLSASVPYIWLKSAQRLKRAADKLYNVYSDASKKELEIILSKTVGGPLTDSEVDITMDSDLYRVHRLLIAYAFENLLKGILVSRNPQYIKPNGRLDSAITKHNLVELFEKCGLPLNPSEKALLHKLSIYGTWLGRYHIPKDINRLLPKIMPDGTEIRSGESFPDDKVIAIMNELYFRLMTLLLIEHKKWQQRG